jgi:prepilin-type N-terminal cleavage/methylation domain-containing protein
MNNKGFTLIEVLVGLFIAVVASAYMAKTITSTNKVVAAGRDNFIATNIAHEGIELTRAMRDNTWFLYSTPADRSKWMSESGICGDVADTANHPYTIDPEVVQKFANNKDNKVLSNNSQTLYIKNTNKLWVHDPSGAKVTPYKRLMEADCSHMSEVPAYVTISSRVTWFGKNGEIRSVYIKEQLYNWL